MVKNNLKSQYYHWLCEKVGHVVNGDTEGYNGHTYWLLLKDLHQKAFFWSVPNDDNRAYEGLQLREEFQDEVGVNFRGNPYVDTTLDGECTMLELIIGLAKRCASVMEDQEVNIPTSDWFWKLLHNARLDRFTDDSYFECGGSGRVEMILDKILERTYHRDGEGGFFPLKNHKKDQRKVELWYQLNAYLLENYYFPE